MDWSVQLYILGEVSLALVLSGLIGLERELDGRPAGLRTQMLVAGSAALLVGLGEVLLERFSAGGEGSLIRADPIRIVEAIITGISFLGAGTIFRRGGEHVEGLTTAATLLLSGALGICVALRQMVLAIGVTLLTLVILRGFQRLESLAHRETPKNRRAVRPALSGSSGPPRNTSRGKSRRRESERTTLVKIPSVINMWSVWDIIFHATAMPPDSAPAHQQCR